MRDMAHYVYFAKNGIRTTLYLFFRMVGVINEWTDSA